MGSLGPEHKSWMLKHGMPWAQCTTPVLGTVGVPKAGHALEHFVFSVN